MPLRQFKRRRRCAIRSKNPIESRPVKGWTRRLHEKVKISVPIVVGLWGRKNRKKNCSPHSFWSTLQNERRENVVKIQHNNTQNSEHYTQPIRLYVVLLLFEVVYRYLYTIVLLLCCFGRLKTSYNLLRCRRSEYCLYNCDLSKYHHDNNITIICCAGASNYMYIICIIS